MTAPGRDWARTGLWLVGATLAYNVIEAVIALWFGAAAGSIALVGFGLDSGIEVAAAGVMLWRLSLETRGADPHTLERAERRVHRFVGFTFLALAAYVTVQAIATTQTAAIRSRISLRRVTTVRWYQAPCGVSLRYSSVISRSRKRKALSGVEWTLNRFLSSGLMVPQLTRASRFNTSSQNSSP